MNLPESIAQACAPLIEALPLEEAMSRLVGSAPVHSELVDRVLASPAMAGRSDLAAGLWLYVDNLERSHTISQSNEDETGSYWHGIMHRREGDFSNSHYWMRRAARHPLILGNSQYNPDTLIDDVAHAKGDDAALVERQRKEWQDLFEWCANNR